MVISQLLEPNSAKKRKENQQQAPGIIQCHVQPVPKRLIASRKPSSRLFPVVARGWGDVVVGGGFHSRGTVDTLVEGSHVGGGVVVLTGACVEDPGLTRTPSPNSKPTSVIELLGWLRPDWPPQGSPAWYRTFFRIADRILLYTLIAYCYILRRIASLCSATVGDCLASRILRMTYSHGTYVASDEHRT
jgi:hypothetical protein